MWIGLFNPTSVYIRGLCIVGILGYLGPKKIDSEFFFFIKYFQNICKLFKMLYTNLNRHTYEGYASLVSWGILNLRKFDFLITIVLITICFFIGEFLKQI